MAIPTSSPAPFPRSATGVAACLAVALAAAGCATSATGQAPGPDEGEPRVPPGAIAPEPSTANPSGLTSWDAYAFSAAHGEEASVVIASGQGRVEVDPDRARVVFAVETEAESAAEAGASNAARMQRVMAEVRSAAEGVPGLRLETSGYSLSPRYAPVRQDQEHRIVGYTARNSVVVTLDDVEAVARVMDAALRGGANRLSGLSFHLQNPEPHRRAALREAVTNARDEARVMAEALGMTLGEPIQVQGGAEMPFQRGPVAFEMARAMDMGPETPVEAGLQTVTASATVRFRLLAPGR